MKRHTNTVMNGGRNELKKMIKVFLPRGREKGRKRSSHQTIISCLFYFKMIFQNNIRKKNDEKKKNTAIIPIYGRYWEKLHKTKT